MGNTRKINTSKAKEKKEKHDSSSLKRNFNKDSGSCVTEVAALSVHATLVLCVYVYTMYPSISGGDSGELITAAHELGVAHPPGYPLFTMLAWVAIKAVPMWNVAWRVNLMNAVFAGAATFILSLTIYRYTRSVGCSLFGSSLWSFSKLTWTWSTTAEVFGLNNLCTITMLYLMIMFYQSSLNKKHKIACIGAFVCGLSLCNQHTTVVYVAVIAVWVIRELYIEKLLSFISLVQLGVCFLCGLIPYLYLPMSSIYSTARWTWGDQSTWTGFKRHLLREEYGTFDLAKGQAEHDGTLFSNLRGYADHCVDEFTLAGVLLCGAGALVALLRLSRCLLVTMVMCVLYLVLFSWRANLSLDNPLFLGVVERFWMQADCVVTLMSAVGLHAVFSFLYGRFIQMKQLRLEIAIAIVACALQMQKNFTDCNQRNNTVVAEFGARLLNNMPRNALVLTVGDLPSNVLRYMYLCDNDRPDVQVLDNELLTYTWFVPMLRHAYPNISFPGNRMETQTGILDDGQRVFNSKTFLDLQYDRFPIVGCIGMQKQESSWMTAYETFPYGPCSLLIRKGENVNLESFIQDALQISDGWDYPFEGFDGRTWERVATDEMWSAKINIPLSLYETAVQIEETKPELYATLMINSYQLYKKAVDVVKTDIIPYYWHTNYALACERLLRLEHSYSKAELLNNTIFHFEMTVLKNPHDKDVPLIKKSIEHLKKYVGKH